MIERMEEVGKKCCSCLLMLCGFLNILTFSHFAYAWPVPDTGQTKCYDDTKEIPCPTEGEAFYGQDGNYSINCPSYTKLNSEGDVLSDSATSWTMVKDNVTGLMWEVKTNKDGIKNYNDPHDADNTYTWYDPDPTTNGDDAGTPGNRTDTKDFIDALNNAKFGGFDDWRLPTIKELAYLVDYSVSYSGPTVNTSFFPNTKASDYWSSTTNSNHPDVAWYIQFNRGWDSYFYKSDYYYVRAVRGGQTNKSFVDNGDGTVTDTSTGLMWQKDTARDGQGSIVSITWQEALSYCESLSLAEHTDWRLPSIKELRSIVDYCMYAPSIAPVFNETFASEYWSSTTDASISDAAWAINFYSGNGLYGYTYKSLNYDYVRYYYVRAVRGGQDGSFGNLRVVIEPSEARSAGAQWRRTGTAIWRDSGYTESNIHVGSYTVEYKDVTAWIKPVKTSASIVTGQTTNLTGTYVLRVGSLRVVIEPSEARSAGVQWRRVGSSTWLDSDYTEFGVPAGSQSVEYKPIEGWEAPSTATVVINEGEVAGVTGTYLTYEVSYADNLDASCGGKNPCFQSIQSALSAQGAAKLIKVREGLYNEELNLAQNQLATIRGGYAAGFSSLSSNSSVRKITVTAGRLGLENIVAHGDTVSPTGTVINESFSPSFSSVMSSSGVMNEELVLGGYEAKAMMGTVEDYLLRSRDFRHSGHWLSDAESLFLRDFITNLYRECLGREAQEWALEIWELSISYLIYDLDVRMEQALWDVAVFVFDSEEYKSMQKDRSALVADAFRGLLWREGAPEEKAYLLRSASTTPQILHEISSSVEFVSMVRGASPGDGYDPINATLAEVYIFMMDRLPASVELKSVSIGSLDEASYYTALLDFVHRLAVSDEFKKLAIDPENAQLRIDNALKGIQP